MRKYHKWTQRGRDIIIEEMANGHGYARRAADRIGVSVGSVKHQAMEIKKGNGIKPCKTLIPSPYRTEAYRDLYIESLSRLATMGCPPGCTDVCLELDSGKTRAHHHAARLNCWRAELEG